MILKGPHKNTPTEVKRSNECRCVGMCIFSWHVHFQQRKASEETMSVCGVSPYFFTTVDVYCGCQLVC